jgi:hypothetical protein
MIRKSAILKLGEIVTAEKGKGAHLCNGGSNSYVPSFSQKGL